MHRIKVKTGDFLCIMGLIMLLAFSVSLDVLGIGAAYAVSGIRIPWNTRIVISGINTLLTMGFILAGQKLGMLVPEYWFQAAGGGILVVLGSRTLWNALGENATADYDKDDSHTLEPLEGIVLGLTLALDGACAGLGICDMGAVACLFPIFTGSASLVFLSLGARISCNLRRLNGAAGAVLVILGVIRFFYG